MKKCIAIFGPTASGKSSLALHLAKEMNSVVISVDSMQIYRGMDIGTAKPSIDEMTAIPHKLINICDPSESFSVYEFKKKAEEEIRIALSAGKMPILVGGTGLYFDALFNNTDFGEFEVSQEIRSALKLRLENEGSKELLRVLQKVDPKSAEGLHEKDCKRIIRALEVYYSTGTTLSQYKENSHRTESEFSFLKLYLVFQSRQNLYRRINERVDIMVKNGLVQEARQMYDECILEGKTASQAIGYKELVPYFSGEKPLDDCIDTLKQKTRNYAKRQITWFRRYDDAFRIVMDGEDDPFAQVLTHVNCYLKEETE